MAKHKDGPIDFFQTHEVFEAERKELKFGGQPTALCLSGGGIRSAAFCLGAVQALASVKLLHQFDYLSTVSGGGYIGAWLTRCIAEKNEDNARNRPAPPVDVVKYVEENILIREGVDEAPALRQLRHYTNYLTPHPGLSSLDTWAGIMLWLRNTLINWSVFFPLMLATATIPCLYFTVTLFMSVNAPADPCPLLSPLIRLTALLCLGIAVFHSCTELPSRQTHRHAPFGLSASQIWTRIVIWTLVWAFLAPLAIAPDLLQTLNFGAIRDLFEVAAPIAQPKPAAVPPLLLTAMAEPTVGQPPQNLLFIPLCAWITCMAAYAMAALKTGEYCVYGVNLCAWAISAGISALLLWAGAYLAFHTNALWLAIAGPVWVLSAEMLRSTVYVAVRKDALRTDLDREWLARLNAMKLRTALLFAAVGTTTLVLPLFILDQPNTVWRWAVGVAGLLTGPTAAFIGSSARTAFMPQAKDKNSASWLSASVAVGGATLIFAVALFMLLGRLSALIITMPAMSWTSTGAGKDRLAALAITACAACLCVLAFAGLAFWIDRCVNLNRFSMHAVYRNRLVRAFLGTARKSVDRYPDRFTQFDPRDNIRVCDTFDGRTATPALFPVINVTLNRTSGKDTARAERKGESFTITPLHCGSPSLGERGAYVRTCLYAGADKETGPDDLQKGITLGAAMTISGAAVSPDMGYQSSPFTAFLMTLFNVRLGAWLPNPGATVAPDEELIRRSGPLYAIPELMAELTGQSDDKGRYVYLSDGGHFDNLGLYEMLLRRCKIIVVIDAGRDGTYSYTDLGHSLQQTLIDTNIKVDFSPPLRSGDDHLPQKGAYARITYPELDSKGDHVTGKLLYIKPWLPSDAPTELQAFQKLKNSFPHGSTLDQFFTESDFESYRRLGEFLTCEVIRTANLPQANAQLSNLFS